jgi:hypothetical protein
LVTNFEKIQPFLSVTDPSAFAPIHAKAKHFVINLLLPLSCSVSSDDDGAAGHHCAGSNCNTVMLFLVIKKLTSTPIHAKAKKYN